ncbi:unnamed protein product [Dovyalis caffra]|uniref:Uncharacterized protein n=1 Tax=Dovyalis caffra TaxID=77055 RepID=A0AAV1QX05_9ROSI|nr:unnamed protein product [Dovyalis caffra]
MIYSTGWNGMESFLTVKSETAWCWDPLVEIEGKVGSSFSNIAARCMKYELNSAWKTRISRMQAIIDCRTFPNILNQKQDPKNVEKTHWNYVAQKSKTFRLAQPNT